MGKPGLVLGVAAAVLAAAGAVYWVGYSDPSADAPYTDADGDADAATTPDSASPTLHGRSKAPAAATAALALTIRGRVADAEGAPVDRVVVSARRMGPPLGAGAFTRDDARPETGFRQLLELLDEPRVGRVKPEAETTTGADGQYELRLEEAGFYLVSAEPPPPRVGSSGTASLSAASPSANVHLIVKTGSRLLGRVVDASDRGVEAVISGYWDGDSLGGTQGWNATPVRSGRSTGEFALDGVPDGKGHLRVYLSGRATLRGIDVTTPHEGVVVIRIGAGGVIRGRVIDSEGQGVASADLTVTTSGGGGGASAPGAPTGGTFRAKTATDGLYRIEGVVFGKVERVAALASGYVLYEGAPPRAAWSGATVTEAGETTIDVTLLRGGTLVGRVVESGTGAGVPEATVLLFRTDAASNNNGQPLSATSDLRGAYSIEGVAIGKWVVVAESASHFLPAIQPPSDPNAMYGPSGPQGPPLSLQFVLTKEGETVHRDIEMKRGLPAGGRVVGPDGAAVAGARVRSTRTTNQSLWSWGGGLANFVTMPKDLATSGEDGAFSIEGLPPQEACVLVALKEGLVGVPCEAFRVAVAAPPPAITLKMTAGGTLAGRAVDDDGKPVAGASVNYSMPGGTAGVVPNTQSAADGSFTFRGVPEGRITLSAGATGFSQVRLTLDAMGPGERREGVEIRFLRGATLSGVVVDADGKPVANRQIWARASDGRQSGSGSSMTAADGTFVIAGLAAGKVVVNVTTGGSRRVRTDIPETYDAPGAGIRIVVAASKTTVVSGRVTDPAGGAIPLCFVSVRQSSSPARQAAPGQAGAPPPPPPMAPMPGGGGEEIVNGEFRIEVEGEPPFSVVASLPRDGNAMPMNLKSKTVSGVDPAAGPVVIALDVGLEIRGHVVGPEGTPVEDAGVTVGSQSTRTDAKGSFRAGGLDEGILSVTVSNVGSLIAPPPASVKAGTLDVVVKMTVGAVIAGQVFGPDQKPVVNCQVQAVWKAQGAVPQGAFQAIVGADGRFRVEPIPNVPSVTLIVRPWGGQRSASAGAAVPDVPQPLTLENVRPGTSDLVIRLLAGATIAGRVVTPTGEGLPSVYLQARALDATSGAPVQGSFDASGQTGADGSFAIGGLAPGLYLVGAQARGGDYIVDGVRLEAPGLGVRIEAVKVGSISGRIEGDGDLSQFGVQLFAAVTAGQGTLRARTDAAGAWKIDGIGGGLYALAASKQGDERYGFVADVKAGASNVVIRLVPGRAIEGILEDASGAPVAERGRVWVVGSTWFSQAAAEQGTGRFRIAGLPSGRYKLYGAKSGALDSALLENVEAGATGLHLRLPAN